jgi:hypothetical protein
VKHREKMERRAMTSCRRCKEEETIAAEKPFLIAMASSDAAPYRVGDVVQTSYGVGVLIGTPSQNDSTDTAYQVRLWRMPGRSIGSSSVAYLHSDAVSSSNFVGKYISLKSIFLHGLFSF